MVHQFCITSLNKFYIGYKFGKVKKSNLLNIHCRFLLFPSFRKLRARSYATLVDSCARPPFSLHHLYNQQFFHHCPNTMEMMLMMMMRRILTTDNRTLYIYKKEYVRKTVRAVDAPSNVVDCG